MRILFAGGGTGGHLFPAIAIAEEITVLNADSKIAFVGTRYGIEYRMRNRLGYPLALIAIRGLARKLSLSLVLFPIRLIVSIWQSLRIIRRFHPDVIVGTGGYVAAPVIIAAVLKKIPRVLQEQNSYPGLVTRKLASKVNVVFTAYSKAEEYLSPGVTCRRLGNPIRSALMRGDRDQAMEEFGLKKDRTTILVLGGSQGARRINEAVLGSLEGLDNTMQILWQCGKRDYTDVAARADKTEFVVSLFPFSDEMELVYAAADVAIARAGALTIAELTACGIPAILVPYPFATADHQTHNAAEVVAAGAGEMIADSDLDNIKLINRAADIIRSGRLQDMREAARRLGRPQAAADIAREVLRLAEDKGEHGDADNHGRTNQAL